MVSKLAILVVLAGALSVAMSAPNRSYGGGTYQDSYGSSGGVYEDRPGPGHLGTNTSGQSGGVYDNTPGQGHLGVAGHHQQTHQLGENGHGQQQHHQGHRLGENGHGQRYHTEPGQEIGHGQQGGQYTDNSHGGGYQQHGY